MWDMIILRLLHFHSRLVLFDTFIISAVRRWARCPRRRARSRTAICSPTTIWKSWSKTVRSGGRQSPKEAFARIKELYERKARVLENYNESQLEENFIRPVLRILGHYFGVQGKVLGKDRTPDYAFFPDQESLDEAEARPERTTTGAP